MSTKLISGVVCDMNKRLSAGEYSDSFHVVASSSHVPVSESHVSTIVDCPTHPLVAFTKSRSAHVLSIQFQTAALLQVSDPPNGKQIHTSFLAGLLVTNERL
jgi:hypothetical protein